MREASDLLFIHCLTGCHPGSGTALGVVDLPIQRERHTRWPTIPGSSLKGVLRSACRSRAGNDETLFAAFGPDTGNASEHAGALAITDARLLAFPVRSLKGVFAWATCPAALERLARDLSLLGEQVLPEIPAVRRNEAICTADSPLLIRDRKALVLEEFEFGVGAGSADELAGWIASRAFRGDKHTRERFPSHFAILSDDDFGHFVQYATEVAARVGLDYDKKTVKKGALFYEEFLPPETLFHTLALATDSRRQGHAMPSAGVLDWLRETAPATLQIGGDESVGKGICAVRFAGEAA